MTILTAAFRLLLCALVALLVIVLRCEAQGTYSIVVLSTKVKPDQNIGIDCNDIQKPGPLSDIGQQLGVNCRAYHHKASCATKTVDCSNVKQVCEEKLGGILNDRNKRCP